MLDRIALALVYVGLAIGSGAAGAWVWRHPEQVGAVSYQWPSPTARLVVSRLGTLAAVLAALAFLAAAVRTI